LTPISLSHKSSVVESIISPRNSNTLPKVSNPPDNMSLTIAHLFQGESQTAAKLSATVRQRPITGNHYSGIIDTAQNLADSTMGPSLESSSTTATEGT
jgi:hypothetical protein